MSAIVVLRLLHIIPGAVWVGAAWFVALVLEPSLRQVGPPASAQVGAAVGKRASILMHVAAGVNMLSGLALLMMVPTTPVVHTGFLVALFAFGCGVVAGVSNRKAGALGASGGSPDEIGKLLDRGRLFGRLAAGLVTVALAMMAVARYL